MEHSRERPPIIKRSKGICSIAFAVAACAVTFGVGGASGSSGQDAATQAAAQAQAAAEHARDHGHGKDGIGLVLGLMQGDGRKSSDQAKASASGQDQQGSAHTDTTANGTDGATGQGDTQGQQPAAQTGTGNDNSQQPPTSTQGQQAPAPNQGAQPPTQPGVGPNNNPNSQPPIQTSAGQDNSQNPQPPAQTGPTQGENNNQQPPTSNQGAQPPTQPGAVQTNNQNPQPPTQPGAVQTNNQNSQPPTQPGAVQTNNQNPQPPTQLGAGGEIGNGAGQGSGPQTGLGQGAHGRSQQPPPGGSTQPGSGVCHGRCENNGQSSSGSVPTTLPQSTSQFGTGSPTGANSQPPAATTPVAPATPVSSPAPVTTPTTTTPVVTSPPTPASTPAPKVPTPTFTSSPTLLNLGSSGGSGVSLAPATTPPPAAGGLTAAAANTVALGKPPAGTTHVTLASKRAPHAVTHRSSVTNFLPAPVGASVQVIERIVGVVPTGVWIALAASLCLAALGGVAALRSAGQARRRAGEFAAIAAAALNDALTGVLNRRGFMEAAERELARAIRYHRPFVLAYLDVAGLKAVNDTVGHMAGDELLRGVAGLLKDSARADDVVGRIGGDEFGLLLAEQSAEGAAAVIRRIRTRVRDYHDAAGSAVPWDLTIGLAAYPQDGSTLEELLGVADRRLYEQRGIALR